MNRAVVFIQGFVLLLYVGCCAAEVPSPIMAKDQCALMCIDQQRIEKKKEKWHTLFQKQQTKKNMSFLLAGSVIGGGLGLLGWYMLHDSGDHTPVSDETMKQYKKDLKLNYAVYVGNEIGRTRSSGS